MSSSDFSSSSLSSLENACSSLSENESCSTIISRSKKRARTSQTKAQTMTRGKRRRYNLSLRRKVRYDDQSHAYYIRSSSKCSRNTTKKRRNNLEKLRSTFSTELPEFLQMEEESAFDEWTGKDNEKYSTNEDNFETEDYALDWFDQGLEGSTLNIGIGDNCLWRHMPSWEISNFVGWATRYGDDVNYVRSKETNLMNVARPHNASIAKELHSLRVSSFINPWIYMPTPPPKPSILLFLSECATRKLKHSEEKIQKRLTDTRLSMFDEYTQCSRNLHSNDSLSFLSNYLSSSDDDSKYKRYFESFEKSKTAERWSVQRPNGFLNTGSDVLQLNETLSDSYRNVLMTMDETSLVAAGMMVEESITAMLLPLASEHVTRCRRLEALETRARRSSKCKPYWPESKKLDFILDEAGDDSFVEWTLPSTHSIIKLIEKNLETRAFDYSFRNAYLPSSLPPAMTLTIENMVTSESIPEHIAFISRGKRATTICKKDLTNRAIHHWGNVHRFNMDFISSNPTFFELFLDF